MSPCSIVTALNVIKSPREMEDSIYRLRHVSESMNRGAQEEEDSHDANKSRILHGRGATAGSTSRHQYGSLRYSHIYCPNLYFM